MNNGGFLRLKDLIEITRISKSEIYRQIADGRFPRPFKYGRISLWCVGAVDQWIAKIKNQGGAT